VRNDSQEWIPMADDSQQIGDQEIEDLLSQAKDAAAGMAGAPSAASTPNAGESRTAGTASRGGDPAAVLDARPRSAASNVADDASSTGDDVQFLLQQAEDAIASVDNPVQHELEAFKFTDFAASAPSQEKATLDLLRDVELDLRIELGRTEMFLEDVLKLRRGAVVALDKMAGDPVDVYVNGRLVARGEVLVMNDNFCVRVAELITGDEND